MFLPFAKSEHKGAVQPERKSLAGRSPVDRPACGGEALGGIEPLTVRCRRPVHAGRIRSEKIPSRGNMAEHAAIWSGVAVFFTLLTVAPKADDRDFLLFKILGALIAAVSTAFAVWNLVGGH